MVLVLASPLPTLHLQPLEELAPFSLAASVQAFATNVLVAALLAVAGRLALALADDSASNDLVEVRLVDGCTCTSARGPYQLRRPWFKSMWRWGSPKMLATLVASMASQLKC